MHTCRRCFVQLLDYRLVNQRVHLRDNMSLLACLHHFNLIVNQRINFLTQSQGRHDELVPNRWLAIAAKQIEERRSIAAKFIVRRHQAKVSIKLSGAVVVVACAQMQIALNAVILTTDNQNNLRMCL